jgi:hypothetical protein
MALKEEGRSLAEWRKKKEYCQRKKYKSDCSQDGRGLGLLVCWQGSAVEVDSIPKKVSG